MVGVGRLGRAILSYPGFNPEDFISGGVDLNNSVVGETIGGWLFEMEELDQVVAREKISIAIVAVPVEYTRTWLTSLGACGVRRIELAPMAHRFVKGYGFVI
ncbi:MAG: hypothetical protein CM1200mP22_19230 [Dehalococcoidia bacterium]|nr:MAG: hypothetical protein CM1200mP22_19230 [Dehalococcoidia bacterium]